VRFYRIARRSGTETAAIITIARQSFALDGNLADAATELLRSIVSMLVKLIKATLARELAHGNAHVQGQE
jgi:hypothetical protein